MPLDQPQTASHKFGHDVRMTFGEHIEDLRRRLLYALAGVLAAGLFTLLPPVTFRLIGWLAQPFIQTLGAMGFPPQTYVSDPTLGFGIYMKVGLVAAIILAAPWVLYQGWRFVVDGLYPHERRAVHLLAPLSAFMTLAAVLFTRYVLLPVSLAFFVKFATLFPEVEPGPPELMVRLLVDEDRTTGHVEPDLVATLPRLPVLPADPVAPEDGACWINQEDGKMKAFFNGRVHVLSIASTRMLEVIPNLREYIHFATLVGLGNVVAFQLPVVMLVLGWTRLVEPEALRKLRKYAFFGCAAAAAILTPADVVSMLVLMFPLYGLFELGLLLMRWSYHRATPAGGPDGEE